MACEEAGPGWGGRELESFTVKHRPTHHGWMSATQGCWSEPNVQGKLAELGPVSEDTTSLNATTTAQNITRKTVPFSGFDGAFPSLMTHRLIIKGAKPSPPAPPHQQSYLYVPGNHLRTSTPSRDAGSLGAAWTK